MSFFTREQRYEILCSIKRGERPEYPTTLTSDEEAFIVEYATEKFDELMKDPEVVAVMKRLKER
jgi:hypothetical protein